MVTSIPNLGGPMAGGVKIQIIGAKALRNRLNTLGRREKITEPLRKRLITSWQAGGAAFIRTTLKQVAVETGMSAATFFALGKAIKRNSIAAIISAEIGRERTVKFRRGVPTFPIGKRRPGIQDVDEGRRLGDKAFIFKTPDDFKSFFVFEFSFQTVSFQMAINDKNAKAIEAGQAAFDALVRKSFERDARFLLKAFYRGQSLPAQNIGQ